MKTRAQENIRELRRILGLTQEAFATLVGVSKDTVASWETGRNRLSEGMARRLALVTGVDGRSLRKPGGPLQTLALPRRQFTLEEFRRHQKSFWGASDEKQLTRHVERCSDALELLFRAAATAGGEAVASRLAGVLDSFSQWCQQTRKDFHLEKLIDAQLETRTARLELTKSYGQWREMARTDPEMARKMGFKEEATKDAGESLKLSITTVPTWMPGHDMRGRRAEGENRKQKAESRKLKAESRKARAQDHG